MKDPYRPQLTDLALFVASVHSTAHGAETEPLFQWLLGHHLEFRSAASPAAASPAAVSSVDLAELRLCLHTSVSTPRAIEVAEELVSRVSETAELSRQLETYGRDLGLADAWPAEASRAVQLNQEVDRLVENHEWDMAARYIEANVLGEPIYEQWVTILEARLARGEGDLERLETVRTKLRTEATTLQTSFSLLLQGDLNSLLGHDTEN